jgi:hypothetical protein
VTPGITLINERLLMKGYKPEVKNPQHTKVEIFKGKVKNKITLNLCSRKIY